MKRIVFGLAALLTAALLSLFNLQNGQDSDYFLKKAGIRVSDGDTITLSVDGEKTTVRYLLIDTPELHHPKKPVEELGEEAAAANRELLASGPVRLEYDREKTDKYGRTLAYVWVATPEGEVMINEELMRRGLAVPMIIQPNGKYARRILNAMEDAALHERGLWGLLARRRFTSAQIWSEAALLAGTFITADMTADRVQKSGRRIIVSEKSFSLVAYRDEYTEGLLALKKGDRITARGQIVLSARGVEMPIASTFQIKVSGEP
ncbi:MAG: thermonuclease family protein [Aminivibrio sp.]